MFFRSLYGSRMPQALHPPIDPQASSYWKEDTASSREMVRVMEEADESNDLEHEGKRKSSVLAAAVLAGDEHASRRHSVPTLSYQLEALLRPGSKELEDMEGLRVEDMGSSPVNTQLSPAGLISIAAADIDEAATNNLRNVPPANGELDLAFIRSLRMSSSDANTEVNTHNPSHVANAALTKVLGTLPASHGSAPVNAEAVESESKLFSLLRRHLNMIGYTSFSSSEAAVETEDDAAEDQGKLRFLSLLRRINELRSQQADAENWDGLPYPQIIALPTFKYRLREQLVDDDRAEDDGELNNTVCAVCCDEFKAEEEVRALPCLHFYHRECIDQWLMCHRQCPICKHVVAVY